MSIFVPRLEIPANNNKYYIKSPNGYNPCILGNSAHRHSSLNVLPNCVGYATGRFNEIANAGRCRYLGNTNACNFYSLGKSQGLSVGATPQIGACIVWAKDGAAGHVAIVEEIVSETEIIVSESGWSSSRHFWIARHIKGKDGQWTEGGDGSWMNNKYQFTGFVYNPAIDLSTKSQLKRGMVSLEVLELQQKLNTIGTPNLVEDGSFGPGTETAVRAFQQSRRLTADGIVGEATWATIASCIADTKRPDGVNLLNLTVDGKSYLVWSTNIADQNYIRVADLVSLGLARDVGWDKINKRVQIIS